MNYLNNYASHSIFKLSHEELSQLPTKELSLSTYSEIGDFLSMKVSDLLKKCLGDEHLWLNKTFYSSKLQSCPTFSLEISHIIEDSLRVLDTKLHCCALSTEEAESLGYDWRKTIKIYPKVFANETSISNPVYITFETAPFAKDEHKITGILIDSDVPLYTLLDIYKTFTFYLKQSYQRAVYSDLSDMMKKDIEEISELASYIEDISMLFQKDVAEIQQYKDITFPLPGDEIYIAYNESKEKIPAIVTGLSFKDDILLHYDFQDPTKGSAIFPLRYETWWELSDQKEQIKSPQITM